ncbi:hypothetical protein [Gaetbulibacter sp. PBL-D1]|uniref:hypothetical protein n=1 Tax=Gaetbulibacter sp. PBL-D1 TaxID=3422594 RepID=UPI003D2F462D
MTDKNTNDLHAGLVALQEQLEKLDSASQQIEQVKTIGKSVIDAMSDLQDKYEGHLQALTSENKKVLQGHDNVFKEQLLNNKEANSKLVQNTEKAIEEIKHALNDNVEENQKVHQKNSEEIASHLTLYSEFVNKVESLTKTIESVNFPNRLDKLDNTVSAINLGIQNMQSSIANSERVLLDELKKNSETVKSEFELSKINQRSLKKNVWVFGLVIIILSLILIVKSFTN